MIPAISTSSDYLLQPGLQELHRKTLEWESSLELWKRELAFFKTLIREYGKKLYLKEEILERDHFELLLTYYSGELMETLHQKILKHELHLKDLVRNQNTQDENSYRIEHSVLDRQIRTVEREIQCYKGELFSLVEKVLSKQKLYKN